MAVGCLMDKQKYRGSFYSLNQEGFISRRKSADNIVKRDRDRKDGREEGRAGWSAGGDPVL